MPYISWDDVIRMGLTHLRNTDYTYTHFEGEIDTITRTKDTIVITCKWVRVLKPTLYDSDGDPSYDGAEWKPHHKTQVCFTQNEKPLQHYDGNTVSIKCWLMQYYTETHLSKKRDFESLKPRIEK